MQDIDRDFDLKVRSMLDGVEEEVPQRVWQGVSSRIGRRSAPAAWKRWAAVGVAAAAAAAIAIVLPLSRSNEVVVAEQPLVAEVAAPSVQEPETEPEATVPQGVMEATTKSPSVRRPSGRSMAAVPEEAIDGQRPVSDCAPAQEDLQHKDVLTEQQPQDNADRKPSAKPQEPWSDPFARMAYEDARARRPYRTSFSVNGLVGTNDKPSARPSGPGRMAAQGASASKEGVTDASESVYGVPVTFGLSAKLHFTDRLALGLGVDWSLLTRSFDGKYTSPEGYYVNLEGIQHGAQYIGVPVNLYLDIISNDVVDLYTFVGGSVEKCVSNKYILPAFDNALMAAPTGMTYKESVKGLQYSAAIGLGVQFNFTDHFGLYVDPSMRYWMGSGQPKSIRTQQPLMFSIEAGLRFEL